MPSILHIIAKSKKQRRKLILKKRKYSITLFLGLSILTLVIYSSTIAYQHFWIESEFESQSQLPPFTHSDSRHLLSEFPKSSFSQKFIDNGGFLIYLLGMFYTFVAIAIVCDEYFVPTLEVIVDTLKMSPDTAGATWLAAGGSAPELFTSFIGTFVAQSDVGFGTIIGSAVFNVLFVIGVCAIATPGDLPLTWFPFARDMSYYLVCLVILAVFFGGVSKNTIEWWECVILFSLYLFYVYIMTQNEKIRVYVMTKVSAHTKKDKLLTPAFDDEAVRNKKSTFGVEHFEEEEEGPDISWPSGDDVSLYDQVMYVVQAPLSIPIYFTLVDVTQEENMGWWPWTFFGSLVWLGVIAYLMVWWAVEVGNSWGIPDELMGIVFLAAGTSVPELFSCVIVAKKGEADMAVSGSIGSNVFDILVGLPIPWLSYCILEASRGNKPQLKVEAENLFFSLLLLLAFIGCVLFVIMWNQWTMTTKMGVTMIGLYCVFVTQDVVRYFAKWDVNF